MLWIGKLIGSIIGLMMFKAVGLVIGFYIGHQFDRYMYNLLQRSPKGAWATQTAFFNATFKVMGMVAKADGRVSEQEIRTARVIMQRMRLNEEQRLRAIELFTAGKDGNIQLSLELANLKRACHNQRPLLQMFLDIQFQAAFADGFFSASKQTILQQICRDLGFAMFDFTAFNQQGRQQSQHRQYQQYSQARSGIDDAYSTLSIAKSATNAEVKKAYRKLMSQNHPDKLVSKGLPESMIKLATEKTQKIQAAYDQICTARGM